MEDDFEKYFIAITFITSFFAVFITNGVIIGTPSIAEDFGMNNVLQNWIPTILVLVTTIFTLPSGQLCGKFGFRKCLLIAESIIVIGLILCCISTTTELFFTSRVLQGLGIAIGNVCEMAIIVLAIDSARRGKTIGIIVTAVYLGTSISPVACGFLVENFGWRSMFYLTIFFDLVCLIISYFKITDEWKPNADEKIDYKGIMLYMIGITLFIYGITELINTTGQILTVAGFILLVIFGYFELHQKMPAFEFNLFKNRSFTAYNIAGVCGYLAVMVLTTIFNYHFQYVRGWNTELTGLVLLISPVVMSITAPNAGKLSDRIHPQKIATVGMAVAIFAFLILIFLDKSTPIPILILAMVLQAFGMGLFSGPNMNAIMSAVSDKYASHASACQLTMRAIGQTLSLSILTLVFSWVMGSLQISEQYAGMVVESSQIVCIICGIACVFAVIISIIGLKSEKKISE